jgi:hypothetical protein
LTPSAPGKARWRLGRIGWLVLIALAFVELWHPFIWISLPVAGHVSDAKTQLPVAGAVVAANWSLRGVLSDAPVAQLKVQEAKTDVQGNFVLRGWVGLHFGVATAPGKIPEIWAVRAGYLPARGGNNLIWGRDAYPLIYTAAQHLQLRPARDASISDYGSGISELTMHYASVFASDPCARAKLPGLLAQLRMIRTDLASHHGPSGGAYIEAASDSAGCH